jgi:histidyl-tRNA synthetase
MEILARHGFESISLPYVEETRLFARSAGETSDIVEKQMFTIPVPDGESLSLRPEATAGAVRAWIEHSMGKQRPFVKLAYCGPMFRYERPQAARQRQFHQVGGEMIGSDRPLVDVATLTAATEILRAVGLEKFRTRINTIGCRDCRPVVKQGLKDAIEAKRDDLCDTCKDRLDRNPLRVLDCNRRECQAVAKTLPAPPTLVCADCRDHYDSVLEGLRAVDEPFEEDPLLVRGLDYYTRTLMEFTVPELGARDAVGGGGRYDDLVEELGGDPAPAIGFSLGVEAILLAVEKTGGNFEPAAPPLDAYVAVPVGKERLGALKLASDVRAAGASCDLDLVGRSLKAQMRAADRAGARFVLVMGPDEEERGAVRWKPMRGEGEEEEISRDEAIRRLGTQEA